jgi:hypothetical protein
MSATAFLIRKGDNFLADCLFMLFFFLSLAVSLDTPLLILLNFLFFIHLNKYLSAVLRISALRKRQPLLHYIHWVIRCANVLSSGGTATGAMESSSLTRTVSRSILLSLAEMQRTALCTLRKLTSNASMGWLELQFAYVEKENHFLSDIRSHS